MGNFAKTTLVLISGRAGVGKTTTAGFLNKYLRDTGYSVRVANFAYWVKQVAYTMGWDGAKDERGRRLLTEIGAVGRAYDVDTWAKCIQNSLELEECYPFDFVIFDDWRFPNEGDYLSTFPIYKPFRMRIESPDRESLKGTPAYYDVSETSLPDGFYHKEFYNKVIFNLGDLTDLRNQMYWLKNELVDFSDKWE